MRSALLIADALLVLEALGLPRQQRNERSALCLLALLDLRPGSNWAQAAAPLVGITPIMGWMAQHYGKRYKPNTRETVRRQTMHQFVAAGIAAYNPDSPSRPVNSPHAVYQVTDTALQLLRRYGSESWSGALRRHLDTCSSLAARYAQARAAKLVAIESSTGSSLLLSPGAHSELIKAIVEQFVPRFAPGAALLYAGDTGNKWACCDQAGIAQLGVQIDAHGKMPDVVLHDRGRDWLLLIEAVTSHGPIDGKRHDELAGLFAGSRAGLVYVTAFPDRAGMRRHVADIAWETEVWVAEAPSHLIHFNGERFLGPYSN